MTGIESIDKEHEQLFKIINEAQALLEEQAVDVKTVKSIVAHLVDYAAEHFAHEEAYMESINDPELMRQKKEHTDFANKVKSVDFDNMTDEESRKELAELVKFLAKWLYHHILGSDIMIGKLEPVVHKTQDSKKAENVSTAKKGMFEFTDEYKTDIDFVDAEHKKLFEIIERTYELKDYTKLHFKDEEEYMEKIGYEGLAAQKLAHESFVDRLTGINMEEVDDGQQEYLFELIDYLLEWLKNHILKMDKQIPAK